MSYGTLITSYLGKIPKGTDATEGLEALFQVFTGMADIASRLTVNAVNSGRILHLQEMSFRNESTEENLRTVSTLGPKLFGGKYYDLLHDSATNIRDAKETQHLRKSFKVPDVKYREDRRPSQENESKKRKNDDRHDSSKSQVRFQEIQISEENIHSF